MSSRRWPVVAGAVVSLALMAGLVGANAGGLAEWVGRLHWDWVAISLASSFLSYCFVGASQWELLRRLGHPLAYRHAAGVAAVAQAVNAFVTTGGAGGLALRAHLLKRQGVPFGATMTLSVVWTMLMNASLTLLVAQAAILAFFRASGTPLIRTGSVIGTALPFLATFGLCLAMFNHELRSRWSRKAFGALNRVIFWFSRKELPEDHFEEFDRDLTNGLHAIWAQRGRLTLALVFVLADWMTTFGVLYAALRAVDVVLPLSYLGVAFAVGLIAAGVPMVPGGLGIMEGTMAGILSKFGAPFEAALLAALFFRLFYYAGPLAASIPLYVWLHGRPEHSARRETPQENRP